MSPPRYLDYDDPTPNPTRLIWVSTLIAGARITGAYLATAALIIASDTRPVLDLVVTP